MFRKSRVMIGLLLATTFASGCCFRDRPLLSRFRARGETPDQYASYPYGSPYYGGGSEGQAIAIPCSTATAPCPCSTVPGGVIPGAIMPGGMDFVPGTSLPPLQMQPPTPPSNQPGNAAPMPAGPSDGSTTGLRKAPSASPAKTEK